MKWHIMSEKNKENLKWLAVPCVDSPETTIREWPQCKVSHDRQTVLAIRFSSKITTSKSWNMNDALPSSGCHEVNYKVISYENLKFWQYWHPCLIQPRPRAGKCQPHQHARAYIPRPKSAMNFQRAWPSAFFSSSWFYQRLLGRFMIGWGMGLLHAARMISHRSIVLGATLKSRRVMTFETNW
jgi:hypothetical protein